MCRVCCALFLLFCAVWGKSARVFDPHHLPISLAHSLPFVLMTRSPFPRRRRAGVKRYDGTTPPRKSPAPPFSSPSPSRGVAPSPAPPPPPAQAPAPWPLVAAEESAIISPPAEEDRGTAQLACTPAASVSQILAVSFAADPAELSHQLDAHLANLLHGGSSGLSIASPSEPPPRHSAVYRLLPRTPHFNAIQQAAAAAPPAPPALPQDAEGKASESPPPRFGSALARIRAVAHDVVEQLGGGDEHGSGT